MNLPDQEYILLKDVQGKTLDHLIYAITRNQLMAYCERPRGCTMYTERQFNEYARIVHPVRTDGENLTFEKIELLTVDGATDTEYKGMFTAPINEIRIRPKDVIEDEPPTFIQTGIDMELVKQFITECKAKRKDNKDITLEIDAKFPGISDAKLGELFPEAKHETHAARRKRGQRLRGKAK